MYSLPQSYNQTSKCKRCISSNAYGGAAKRDAAEFKIAYLKKMKEVFGANGTAQDFVEGMKKVYPGLPGEAGLEDLGKALYK